MSSSIHELSHRSTTASEKGSIIRILLGTLHGDYQLAALTGGRPALESFLFRTYLDSCLQHGDVLIASQGGSIDGVLCAFGPDSDLDQVPYSLLDPSNDYVAELIPEMQLWWTLHLCPKYRELASLGLGGPEARRAAWHIQLIAVAPDRQNRGVGRSLLEAVLKKADTTGTKVCFEANNDRMVHYFSEYGFRVKATKTFASYQGGFPLFCMVRQPRVQN